MPKSRETDRWIHEDKVGLIEQSLKSRKYQWNQSQSRQAWTITDKLLEVQCREILKFKTPKGLNARRAPTILRTSKQHSRLQDISLTCKSITFLYTNNKQKEFQIKTIIPFIFAAKTPKIFRYASNKTCIQKNTKLWWMKLKNKMEGELFHIHR